MKKTEKLKILIIILISILLFTFCNEDDNEDQLEIEPLIVLTTDILDIKITTAIGGSKITNNSGVPIIEKGICWSTDTIPTIVDSKITNVSNVDSFAINITGLLANKTYFVRAYATTNKEIVYGERVSFTTLGGLSGTVTDIEGNVYRTVAIGEQVWMAENLRTTKYRNGDPIAFVSTSDNSYSSVWCNLTTGAYCIYYDNVDYYNTYGSLYNWWAVNDSRDIAPIGWHIPTVDEWRILVRNLGGENIAGGKLKEVGTVHWVESNVGATDSYGFTALPGGELQAYDCSLVIINYLGFWWSSTSYDTENVYNFMLERGKSNAHIRNSEKIRGFSIRCIKD